MLDKNDNDTLLVKGKQTNLQVVKFSANNMQKKRLRRGEIQRKKGRKKVMIRFACTFASTKLDYRKRNIIEKAGNEGIAEMKALDKKSNKWVVVVVVLVVIVVGRRRVY